MDSDKYMDAVNIAGLINSFDLYYEMADDADNKVWDKGETSKQAISQMLGRRSSEEITVIKSNLNSTGIIVVDRYFKKYFNGEQE